MTDESTLGGYEARHDRPPAFEGVDGRAYSAAVYVDDDPQPDGRFGACVLFVRWNAEGDQPDGHVETPYLVFGITAAEAGDKLRRLSLHELKRQLDAAITAREEMSGW